MGKGENTDRQQGLTDAGAQLCCLWHPFTTVLSHGEVQAITHSVLGGVGW